MGVIDKLALKRAVHDLAHMGLWSPEETAIDFDIDATPRDRAKHPMVWLLSDQALYMGRLRLPMAGRIPRSGILGVTAACLGRAVNYTVYLRLPATAWRQYPPRQPEDPSGLITFLGDPERNLWWIEWRVPCARQSFRVAMKQAWPADTP